MIPKSFSFCYEIQKYKSLNRVVNITNSVASKRYEHNSIFECEKVHAPAQHGVNTLQQ